MEDSRFDAVTRRLGAARTRRGLIATALAAVGGGLTLDDAGAKPRKRRRVCRGMGVGCTTDTQCCSRLCVTDSNLPRDQRNRCACPAGQHFCGHGCIDTTRDDNNCGGCETRCLTGDEACCGGTCTEICFNDVNCGACGETCDTVNGETCDGGYCLVTQCAPAIDACVGDDCAAAALLC